MTLRLLPPVGPHALVLVDQALVSGTSFVTSVLLVRGLGLATFGTFSLVWLLALFAISLGQALLVQPMLTFAPKCAEADKDRYLVSALRLEGVFLGLCALFMGGAYAFLLANSDDPVLAGSGPAFLLALLGRQAATFVRGAAFAANHRSRALAMDAVAYGGQLALLAALWFCARLELRSVLLAIGATSVAGALLGLAAYPRARTERGDLARAAAQHWSFARWLAGMSVVQWFSSNFFLVAAGALLGTAAVGAIKAAQSVIGVLHVLFLALENVVPVAAARHLVEHGRASMTSYLLRVGGFGLAATVLVSGLAAAFPGLVLGLVYGAEPAPGTVLALRGLALLYVFAYAISILHIAYRTLERTRTVALVYAACTLLAVAFAHPIVAAYGLAGAVFGMAAQQGVLVLALAAALRWGWAAGHLPGLHWRIDCRTRRPWSGRRSASRP